MYQLLSRRPGEDEELLLDRPYDGRVRRREMEIVGNRRCKIRWKGVEGARQKKIRILVNGERAKKDSGCSRERARCKDGVWSSLRGSVVA